MDRLTAIKVFVEVIDRGSLTAAANSLDMSRAMTSRYIAELEKWLGSRLLQRSTRKISLTSAGQDALSRFRQMLELSADVETINDTDQLAPHGLLRVAVSISLGATELSRAAADYVSRYPGTTIDLQLAEHAVDLIKDRIDLAVRITNDINPGLIARKLSVSKSAVVASPAYLQRHGTPERIEELIEHNCLTHSHFGKNVWRFVRGGEQVDVAVTGNICANDANALTEIALAGAGIASLPTFLVASKINSGELIMLFPDSEREEMGMYGIYTSRRHMPAILRTFIDFLVERFGSTPYWDSLVSERLNVKI